MTNTIGDYYDRIVRSFNSFWFYSDLGRVENAQINNYYASILFGFIHLDNKPLVINDVKLYVSSILFGFILRGSPIGEWGLQFFEFILSVIIFLFVVLFKLYLLLFS